MSFVFVKRKTNAKYQNGPVHGKEKPYVSKHEFNVTTDWCFPDKHRNMKRAYAEYVP